MLHDEISRGVSHQPVTSLKEIQFEPLLNTEQAACLLRIHPKTLQKMARRGEIHGIQVGRLWRFRASALNRWLGNDPE
jgi:excisionase family DNA binding protein